MKFNKIRDLDVLQQQFNRLTTIVRVNSNTLQNGLVK